MTGLALASTTLACSADLAQEHPQVTGNDGSTGESPYGGSKPRGRISELQRPLGQISSPGKTCTISHARVVNEEWAEAAGPGPVYPVVSGNTALVGMEFPVPPDAIWFGSDYSGQKIPWIVAPQYDGPVLIRGISATGQPVRFGLDLSARLFIPRSNSGSLWRFLRSYTRVPSPGCYAWQVDGAHFSYLIGFRVVDP